MKTTLGMLVGSVALLAVVLAVGGGLAWYKHREVEEEKAKGPPPEIPEAISTAYVSAVSFRQSVSAVGTIAAPRWITLRNEVPGTIVAIEVKSGMVIDEGSPLVVLDTSVERPTLEAAIARRKLAESTCERGRQLNQSNAISAFELEQGEAALAQAKAEINRLSALIAKKTLQAPFRARVGLINVSVGQYLSEGAEITTLHGIDDYVNVDFLLPQTVAAQIEIGQIIALEHGGTPLTAQVVAWDSKSDKSTRNKLIRAELREPPANLAPNDSVKVSVEYGPEIRACAVPVEALRRTPMGAHVFVVENDDKGVPRTQPRTVIPGRSIGRELVIMSGLTERDRVVTDGSFKLRAGTAVRDASHPGEDLADPISQSPSTPADPAASAERERLR